MPLIEGMDLQSLTYNHSALPNRGLTPEYLAKHLPLALDLQRNACTSLLESPFNLPPELTVMILDLLDLRNLMDFRHCSHSILHFVDSLPRFQAVVKHAAQVLRGILAIRTTAHITLPMLYNTLCQRHCKNCGRLAQYIWLVTCTRVCMNCMHAKNDTYPLVPLRAHEMIALYGFPDCDLASIPSYQSVPFKFGDGTRFSRLEGENFLWDTNSAAQIAYTRFGAWYAPGMRLASDRFEQDSEIDDLLERFSAIVEGRASMRYEYQLWTDRRKLACVLAPWIKRGEEVAEEGVFCAICARTKKQNEIYTREGVKEHLRVCRVSALDEQALFLRGHAERLMNYRGPVLGL